jgi:hypothetical protein
MRGAKRKFVIFGDFNAISSQLSQPRFCPGARTS